MATKQDSLGKQDAEARAYILNGFCIHEGLQFYPFYNLCAKIHWTKEFRKLITGSYDTCFIHFMGKS